MSTTTEPSFADGAKAALTALGEGIATAPASAWGEMLIADVVKEQGQIESLIRVALAQSTDRAVFEVAREVLCRVLDKPQLKVTATYRDAIYKLEESHGFFNEVTESPASHAEQVLTALRKLLNDLKDGKIRDSEISEGEAVRLANLGTALSEVSARMTPGYVSPLGKTKPPRRAPEKASPAAASKGRA